MNRFFCPGIPVIRMHQVKVHPVISRNWFVVEESDGGAPDGRIDLRFAGAVMEVAGGAPQRGL
jgi:hypothetical protein